MDFTKLNLKQMRLMGDNKPIATRAVENPSVKNPITLDSILDKLRNGDLSALDDLDKLRVPSEMIEKDGGYTVKFTFGGAKYSITYYGEVNSGSENPKPPVGGADTTPPKADPETPAAGGTTTPPKTDPETPTVSKPGTDGVPNDKVTESLADFTNAALNLGKIISNTLSSRATAEIANGFKTIHTEFGMDKDGNIVFQEKNTATVFNNILKYVKEQASSWMKTAGIKNPIESIGGEEVLQKLIQTAWMNTYNEFYSSTSQKTEDFLKYTLTNLAKMMNKIAEDPSRLDVYTQRSCYADSTLTDGLTHYGTKTTSGNDEKVDCTTGNVVQHEDGTVHIGNNADDNDYQVTMEELLGRILEKYPNIDDKALTNLFRQAQKNALAAFREHHYDCPYGTGDNGSRVEDTVRNWKGRDYQYGKYIDMDQLVQLTLYNFDKVFTHSCINADTIPGRVEKTPEPEAKAPEKMSNDKAETLKNAAKNVQVALRETIKQIDIDTITGTNKKTSIHTEFGMDKDGNIMFQEKSTTAVYNRIIDTLYRELSNRSQGYGGNGINYVEQLGGKAVLAKLVQASWINTYNTFNSSQMNNAQDFVNKVLDNLNSMLTVLQQNPDAIEIFTGHTAYADTSLTTGLRHYDTKTTNGNDETINYSGNVTTYDDGSVHISNDYDDKDYQATMSGLLNRVINKYPSIGKATVTELFREAQRKALEQAKTNAADCPYGTGNNLSDVEDVYGNRLWWGGTDSRKGDESKIHMDELVQLTLYNFDKLLYNYMLSGNSTSRAR